MRYFHGALLLLFAGCTPQIESITVEQTTPVITSTAAAAPVGIAYTQNPATYPAGIPIVANLASVSGGRPALWEVTPSLPIGLFLDAADGKILGTPSLPTSTANYQVTGTNSVGSISLVLILTVGPGRPLLSYATSSGKIGGVEQLMTVTPSLLDANGAAITSCAIKSGSLALPSGLSVDPLTCVISGTPVSALAPTQYTLVAGNSIGASLDARVLLTVGASPPLLSFLGATGTSAVMGSPMTVAPTTLDTRGAGVIGCAIKAGTTPLPAALAVSPTTCVISGTPDELLPGTVFTLYATNDAGTSDDATVSIDVTPGVPALSYAGSTGTSIALGGTLNVSPSLLNSNGSSLTACAIKAGSTALPATLGVSSTTCAITGTPTTALAPTTFTVVATNAVGVSLDASVTLTVTPGVPLLSYATSTGTSGVAGQPFSVTPSTLNLNGAAITACGILTGTTPLPNSLSVSASGCVISGTPTTGLTSTSFTLVASNAAGTSEAALVTLQITPGLPVLSYATSTGRTGAISSQLTVTPSTLLANGAAITACAIKPGTPALPGTLTVGPNTCVISGTPSALLAPTLFTLRATNTVGVSTDATVTLNVNAGVPLLSYATSGGRTGVIGLPMSVTPSTLITNGADVTGCETKSGTQAIPAGLSLSPTTCVISGTPTALQSSAVFTLRATNSAGFSTDALVTLTVNPGVPDLSYASSTGTSGNVAVLLSVTPSTLNNRGAAVTGCAIKFSTTALPSTLSVAPTTCVISGTPTETFAATTFTLVATNSAGVSADAAVVITVNPSVPFLSFADSGNLTGIVGSPMSVFPSSLLHRGEAITGCTIKPGTPALPAGLSILPTTCVINGTPTGAVSSTLYTLIATNAIGDSADATVTLAITPAAPTLSDISPTTGPRAGGTLVTLTGTYFESGTAVLIGDAPCVNVVFNSATSLTCTTPPNYAATLDVTVTNPDFQNNTLVGGFTATGTATFTFLKQKIFTPICATCHGGGSPEAGFETEIYSQVFSRLLPNDPASSTVYQRVANDSMPQGGPPLTANQKAAIFDWINAGALDD